MLPKLKILKGKYTKRQELKKTDYEIKRNTGHALNVSTCVVHKVLDKMTDGDEKLPEANTRREKFSEKNFQKEFIKNKFMTCIRTYIWNTHI